MPLEADDQARVDEAIRESGANPSDDRVLVRNTPDSQKLGPLTVMCTILNRTIGSGIFVTPAIVLRSTSSVGVSLLFWSFGAVIGMSALLIWLELGLSIPKFELPNRDENDTVQGEGVSLQCVPRNGGEKNYLEYIYRFPKMRTTTCIFGWIYIILGNLSGNAVAFGIYICQAADIEGRDSLVRGLAVVCLTAACLLHASWRKGGIIVNNLLAVMKVLVLVAIIIIGFAASAGASFGHGPVHGETTDPKTQSKTSNFSTHSSFAFASNDPASYAESLLYIIFTFSGYEQPFYVLSEVYRPRKTFAMSTIAGQGLACCLFVLVNIAYLCAVSVDQRLDGELDMATVFFREVFGNQIAPRVMSGIIALSIFGNIVVMTFTASRVKQEIAKEGVIPFSLFFASSNTTPWARLRRRFWPSQSKEQDEESPSAALFLHWIFSMVMIGATSPTAPATAYTILISLYSYSVVTLLGFFVSGGLLYLRLFSRERHEWKSKSGFKPWGGATAAMIYTATCLFLVAARFIPPSSRSPFAFGNTGVQWYIIPTVGLASFVLGIMYYLGFEYIYPPLFKDGKVLIVDREAVIVREHGEYVQALEVVDASWERKSGPGSNDTEMQKVTVAD
ncbi:MAG: hypothetical protein LQ350_006378 [Teloschistes chrysophthalmus]|nr:MAG: hypothetical protein LQ350_006378 [Niorma chrysophthalma]